MDGAANKRTWIGDLSIQDTRELRQMEQGKKEGRKGALEEAVESVTESFNRQKIPAGWLKGWLDGGNQNHRRSSMRRKRAG